MQYEPTLPQNLKILLSDFHSPLRTTIILISLIFVNFTTLSRNTYLIFLRILRYYQNSPSNRLLSRYISTRLIAAIV
jgi:hypothetical protein